jgi:hypothetical protein
MVAERRELRFSDCRGPSHIATGWIVDCRRVAAGRLPADHLASGIVVRRRCCRSPTARRPSRKSRRTARLRRGFGLEVDHVETETRQREYEPDYGND